MTIADLPVREESQHVSTVDAVADVPPGFVRLTREQPNFLDLCQTIYYNEQLGILAARVEAIHLNPGGIAHGGFLATLADTALGIALKREQAAGVPAGVTAHLSVDYCAPARAGAWVEAHTVIERMGGRLSHTSCRLMQGDTLIAMARGMFISARP